MSALLKSLKPGWFDYSISNPFMTAEQIKTARKFAPCWRSETKTYSDAHKDDLTNGLRNMFELNDSAIRRSISSLFYRYEAFVRKHTDVAGVALKGRSAKEEEAFYRCLHEDEARIVHWDEIQATRKERVKQYSLTVQVENLSERCFLVKRPSTLRH